MHAILTLPAAARRAATLETLQTTLSDLRSDRESLLSDTAAAASERDGRLARHLRRALREYDDRSANIQAAHDC